VSRRRLDKELRERIVAGVALVLASPLLATAALAIKVEGLLDRGARGPVLFAETRMAGGKRFELLKLRTLRRDALDALPAGPTHIKTLELTSTTRVGRRLQQWYLDELPQLWNVVRGEMLLIGTRPWPIELYEDEVGRGITRKMDLPGGLVGPVQARKGEDIDPVAADVAYLDLLESGSRWSLLRTDLEIARRSLRVVLEHRGL
jgi:lipopolysaccharide/colanic/teichoic acid biosynthesis glycosyltransferase